MRERYAEQMAAEYAEVPELAYTSDWTCPEHGGGLADCEWIHEIRYQVITGGIDPFEGLPVPDDEPL